MTRRDLIVFVVLTVLIEVVCLFLRFGYGLSSTSVTASTIGVLTTMGLRIHHGYVGAVMIVLTWLVRWPRHVTQWLRVVGLALFVSDMFHHFCVLWPLTGSPQFDLVYPPAIFTLCFV